VIERKHSLLVGETGATFSDCERYRYKLWRSWGPGRTCNFLMLNPSTANELVNDPTVERCQVRARKWGFDGLLVTNLFAYRSSSPHEMKRQAEPIGPDNDDAIIDAATQAGIVVCAWGGHGTHRDRDVAVLKLLLKLCGHKLHALKLSPDGNPCHPLYLPYDLTPVRMESK